MPSGIIENGGIAAAAYNGAMTAEGGVLLQGAAQAADQIVISICLDREGRECRQTVCQKASGPQHAFQAHGNPILLFFNSEDVI